MSSSRVCTTIFLFVITLSLLYAPSPLDALAFAQTAPAGERERGIALLNQRKFKEASKVFRKEADKNKTDPEAWYYLGLALLKLKNQTKNAGKVFETALRLRPDYAAARTGLSYVFLVRNKLPEAKLAAQAALKGHPESAEPHYILGVVDLRFGAHDEALKEAEEAIRLNPQMAAAHLLKSQALLSGYRMRSTAPRNIQLTTSPLTPEERRNKRQEGRALFIQAAESLETYLRLNPYDPGAGTWHEQVSALKVFGTVGVDTPDAKDRVFSGDEVTTKTRVLAKPEPSYTEEARSEGVTGTVVLRAVFAADGTTRHILVLQGLPNGLTERAVSAARRIKFVPATINGRPVSMFIQLEYNFNLY